MLDARCDARHYEEIAVVHLRDAARACFYYKEEGKGRANAHLQQLAHKNSKVITCHSWILFLLIFFMHTTWIWVEMWLLYSYIGIIKGNKINRARAVYTLYSSLTIRLRFPYDIIVVWLPWPSYCQNRFARISHLEKWFSSWLIVSFVWERQHQ